MYGKPCSIRVSHTALRLLAFTLGERQEGEIALAYCSTLADVLHTILPITQVAVVVLDIDPDLRHRRIQQRVQSGAVDPFDRYMSVHPAWAEHIEARLVALATRYLNATIIANLDGVHSSTLPLISPCVLSPAA